jgi:hypothetical protein
MVGLGVVAHCIALVSIITGTITDELLKETKKKYASYWLYAEAPNHTHILLMPGDAAV